MAGATQHHSWPIRDVLDRTDLGALLDEVTTATGAGGRRRWHCPLADHLDAHPSVTIHRDHHGHERWRCWSGDDTHRGDAVDLIAKVHGLDRSAAINELAARAGMQPNQPLPPPRPTLVVPVVRELNPAVVIYAQACERLLWTPLGREVRDYLHGRGLDDAVLRANHIGADPGRERLVRARGLPYGAGVGATFPALDPNGSITYVQTRALRPVDRKYDNPTAQMGPHPRIAWTRPVGGARPGQLLVCEGVPDALIAAQAGYRSVALLGANALDATVAARIANIAQRDSLAVTIVVDVDDPNAAGRRVGQHLAADLAGHDIDVHIVEPPDGHDLNSWALDDTAWATDLRQRVADPRLLPGSVAPPDRPVDGLPPEVDLIAREPSADDPVGLGLD